jgi:hypothetical protein
LFLCLDCPVFCIFCLLPTTQTLMPPAGFEPSSRASERPCTLALDLSATGIGKWIICVNREGTVKFCRGNFNGFLLLCCETSILQWLTFCVNVAIATLRGRIFLNLSEILLVKPHHDGRKCTRWFKYDRDKLWLVYTQIVPVIFEPPCKCLNRIWCRDAESDVRSFWQQHEMSTQLNHKYIKLEFMTHFFSH